MNLGLFKLTNRKQLVLYIFLGLALLQLTIQISVLTNDVEHITASLTNDDAYYYLQTAWNVKQFGFPTFDGIHPTNGVQFLWFWVIAFIALLMPTKIALLFAVLVISFLLNALCYLIIWNLGEVLQRPALAFYMASFWFFLSFGSGIYSIGMENSLHALVFWAIIWRTTVFLIQVQNNKRPELLSLTVLMTLNVWVRLDAAIFSVILYTYCLIRALSTQSLVLSRRKDIIYIGTSILLALLGLVIQLGVFRLMGGSYLPVSMLVKQSRATWDGAAASSAFTGLAAMVLLALIATRLFRLYDSKQKEMTAFQSVWYSLLFGVILHVIATTPVGAYRHYIWYLTPSFIFWIVTFTIIVDIIGNILVKKGRTTIFRLGAVGVCLFIIVSSSYVFKVRLSAQIPLYVTTYNAALWMAKNLPPEAVCASWNAGQLGFFSEHPVINLDGLINSFDYYDRVVQGPLTWTEYIYENEVDYIADYNRNRITLPGFSVIQSFPVADGTGLEFIIWQVPKPDKQE